MIRYPDNCLRYLSLQQALQHALRRELPPGWLFLREAKPLHLETEALFVSNELDLPEPEQSAAALGFPIEGLDDQTLEDVVEGARQIEDPPSDDLLLNAFTYYLKNDAFLSSDEVR